MHIQCSQALRHRLAISSPATLAYQTEGVVIVMMTGTFIIRINGTQAALVLKISVFYERVVSDRNSSRFTSSLYIIVRLRLTFD